MMKPAEANAPVVKEGLNGLGEPILRFGPDSGAPAPWELA